MIREIIKPTSNHYDIAIPKEYINKEIEILILPISEIKIVNNKTNQNNNLKSLLTNVTEGLLDEDLVRLKDLGRGDDNWLI